MSTIIKQLKQANCEYCIVKRSNDYQWIYTCKTLKISHQNGIGLITGESPLGIELKFPLDEITEVAPLEELFPIYIGNINLLCRQMTIIS